MTVLSTGSKVLDSLMDGGLRAKVISLLFGIPNLGKTWFCYQVACMCTRPEKVGGLEKKVLYLDTEGFFFDEDTIKRFAGYFKKRWPDCKPENIEILQISDIFQLGEQFGIQFEILQEDKRVTVLAKFPTERQKKLAEAKKAKAKTKDEKPKEGKKEKEPKEDADVESTKKDKDWLEKAPLWQKIKTGGYGLLVIDSVTIPIKSEIPTATQNFPARTSLLQTLLGACFPIARRGDISILITDHITRNPMSPTYKFGMGDPWGGSNVLYYVKHQFALYTGTQELAKKYGVVESPRIRRVERYRFPGLDRMMVAVKLEKDKGYMDLPEISTTTAQPAQAEEEKEDAGTGDT